LEEVHFSDKTDLPDHFKLSTRGKYGLKSQINRATVSIASNIAEGAGRNSNKEFNQFLGIAIGSMHEVETQIIISFEVGFIEKEVKNEVCDQISQLILMTKGLKNHLV
jgi:four helix bundle protein